MQCKSKVLKQKSPTLMVGLFKVHMLIKSSWKHKYLSNDHEDAKQHIFCEQGVY